LFLNALGPRLRGDDEESVIPAQAGTTKSVIPAQAGTQGFLGALR
jgi:hypothetical protein